MNTNHLPSIGNCRILKRTLWVEEVFLLLYAIVNGHVVKLNHIIEQFLSITDYLKLLAFPFAYIKNGQP